MSHYDPNESYYGRGMMSMPYMQQQYMQQQYMQQQYAMMNPLQYQVQINCPAGRVTDQLDPYV